MTLNVSLLAVALTISLTPPSQAHDGPHVIEQRTGLKSEAVIQNHLRQLGITAGDVVMQGREAEVSVRVNGHPLRLKMDRVTGQMRQVGGALELERALLLRGIIQPMGAVIPMGRIVEPNIVVNPNVLTDPNAIRVPSLRLNSE